MCVLSPLPLIIAAFAGGSDVLIVSMTALLLCVVAVAVYLIWSFITQDWGFTWIVWPIAGVLSAPVTLIAKMISKDEDAL